MAVKSLYLVDTAGDAGYALQDGGVAPTDAFFHGAGSASGWNPGNSTPVPRYANMDYNTEVARASFVTSEPTGTLVTTAGAGNFFRTPTALSGTFANTIWTLAMSLRSHTTLCAADFALKWKIWRSVNSTGSGATAVSTIFASATQTASLSTTANTTITATWTPGATVTLNNEYLFFVCYMAVTVAGGAVGDDASIRKNSASVITTPNFTVSSPPVNLDGILDLTGSGAAVPEVSRNITGVLNSSLDGVAVASVTRNLAGDVNVIGSGAGALQVQRNLAGAVDMTESSAAVPQVSRNLAGVMNGTVGYTASLEVSRLLASSFNETTDVVGALQVSRILAGVLGNTISYIGELESSDVLLFSSLDLAIGLDTDGPSVTRLLSEALPMVMGYQAIPEVSRPLRGILEAQVDCVAAPPEVTRLLSGTYGTVVVLDTTGISTETLEPVMVVVLDPVPSAALVLDPVPGARLVLDLAPDARVVLDPIEEGG